MKEIPNEIDIDRCLCPECQVDVDPEVNECPKCGARFSSMADRQRLNTPLIYNVFRWGLLGTALIIGISALVVCLTMFFGKGW